MAVDPLHRRDAQSRSPDGVRHRRADPAREAFLNNIANRLGRARVVAQPIRSPADHAEVHPVVDNDALCARFERELTSLGASCQFASSLGEVHDLLRHLLDHWKARRIISWTRHELADFQLDWLWDERGCSSFGDIPAGGAADSAPSGDGGRSAAAFRSLAMRADVGITGVDFALATTGTLALSAAPGRPRSISLLPAVHVALVRESQILSRLGDALASYARKGAGLPSAIHFISGPSRTSDIENDHTIGVHGPAAVSVIVWRSPAVDA